jgi:hypothetical protein
MITSLNQLGLVLNIVGSLLIAISIGKNPANANIQTAGAKKVYLASFNHPTLFRVGFYLLVFGFILIFISSFINK